MKYVVTADLHIGLSEGHDACIKRGFEHIASVCDSHAADLIIAGDLFDRPKPTPGDYRLAGECLAMVKGKKYVIPGNHDKTGSGSATVHAYETRLFEGHALQVMSDDIFFLGGIKHNLMFAPYFADTPEKTYADRITESYNRYNAPGQLTILVCHIDVPGAIYGAEQEIQIGKVGTLPTGLKNVDLVLAGHIHKHQKFQYGNATVVYPGALSRTSHTEENEAKGFLLLDTEKPDKIRFIKRTNDRQYLTVQRKWTGSFVLPKELAGKKGCIRYIINAAKKYSGMIDRRAIEKRLLKRFDEVRVQINYEREVSEAAKKATTGRGFGEYEDQWLKRHATGRVASIRKLFSSYKKKLDLDVVSTGNRSSGSVLKRVYIKDYQSIGEVECDFAANDCVGILGEIDGKLTKSNGAGKSSFIEAIRFALNGETRYAKNGNAVRRGADGTLVEVDLENGTGDYTVRRALNKRGTATALVLKGDEQLARGPNEVSDWIEKNTGSTKRFFDALIWLGKKRRKALLEARPTDRLKAIQEPLPLDLYEKMLVLIKKDRTAAKSEVDTATGALEALEVDPSELTELKKKLTGTVNKRKKAEQQIKEIKVKIKELDVIARDDEKLEFVIDDINVFTRRLKKKTDFNIKGTCEKFLRDSRNVLSGMDSTRSVLIKDLAQIRAGFDIYEMQQAEKQNVLDLLAGKSECPLCESELPFSKVKQLTGARRQELAEIRKKINEAKDTEAVKQSELNKLGNKISDLKDRCRAAEDLLSLEKDLAKHLAEKEKLEKLHDYSVLKGYDKMQSDLVTLERNLKTTVQEIGSLQSDIAGVEADMKKIKEFETKLKKAKTKMLDLSVLYEACSPRGIPRLISSGVIAEINETLPEVISEFDAWQDIEMYIEEIDNSIEIMVSLDGGESVPVEGFSNGEQEIVNIILVAAWRRVLRNLLGGSFDFTFIDEALDNMDNENLRRAIKYFKRVKQQTLVISHSNLQDSFNKMVVVSR